VTAADRLGNPSAVLTRRDLFELGWGRRAVDAIFEACPVVKLPGYRSPVIQVREYLAYVEKHTYRGDRVRAA
jgi:hypothetical protein